MLHVVREHGRVSLLEHTRTHASDIRLERIWTLSLSGAPPSVPRLGRGRGRGRGRGHRMRKGGTGRKAKMHPGCPGRVHQTTIIIIVIASSSIHHHQSRLLVNLHDLLNLVFPESSASLSGPRQSSSGKKGTGRSTKTRYPSPRPTTTPTLALFSRC